MWLEVAEEEERGTMRLRERRLREFSEALGIEMLNCSVEVW